MIHMFFRRVRTAEPDFRQRIANLQAWGIEAQPQPDGSVLVRRGDCFARVREASGKPLIERTGRIVAGEEAVLVDAGYQKFWLTREQRRRPALAEELKALHDFEEDLREGLGLVSLYNTSLGTVNALHLYDRLKSRDDGATP